MRKLAIVNSLSLLHMHAMSTHPDSRADIPPTMSWFIVTLGIITALGPLSIDMYLPAFGDITQTLGTSMAMVQRSLMAYFIGLGLGQMCYGPISDRFGRTRPLKLGLTLYLIASIGCALSTNIHMLIFLRGAQAFGGSAGAVITRAMVRDRFHHNHSARVFSMLMLVMGVAPILAPILGGVITVHFGWRTIFWVLASASFACLIMSLSMEETRPPEKRAKELTVASIAKVYFGIFKDRNFVVYALMGGFTMAGMFGYIAGAPFVLMDLYGVAKQHFGWFFGSNAMGFVIATQINSRLLGRFSFQKILLAASTTMTLAAMYIAFVGVMHLPLWMLAPGLFTFVSALGFILPNSTAGAMEHQARHAGAASALAGTLQFGIASFATFGISLLQDGTAMPMGIVMIGATGVAWGIFQLRSRASKHAITLEIPLSGA